MNKISKQKGMKRHHFAILLFGASSVFIKMIDMPSTSIVAGRFFISASILLLVFVLSKNRSWLWAINKKDLLFLFLAGLFLAIHGWSFATSIQWASVATGTVTFACFPIFTMIIEKIMNVRTKKSGIHSFMIASALLTIIGAIVLVPELSLVNVNVQGVLIGLLSAITFAIQFMINAQVQKSILKYIVSPKDVGMITTFYNHFFAAVVLSPLAIISATFEIYVKDVILLIALGAIITAVGFTIYNSSLQYDNPTNIAIDSSLEAVYGIFFAFIVMHTIPTVREAIGGTIIIFAVIYNERKRKRIELSSVK
jgi:drug/metabolite transporter (DMT)-like permease